MYTHQNGIHHGISIQYAVSIMYPLEMCVPVLIHKVMLLNGFWHTGFRAFSYFFKRHPTVFYACNRFFVTRVQNLCSPTIVPTVTTFLGVDHGYEAFAVLFHCLLLWCASWAESQRTEYSPSRSSAFKPRTQNEWCPSRWNGGISLHLQWLQSNPHVDYWSRRAHVLLLLPYDFVPLLVSAGCCVKESDLECWES